MSNRALLTVLLSTCLALNAFAKKDDEKTEAGRLFREYEQAYEEDGLPVHPSDITGSQIWAGQLIYDFRSNGLGFSVSPEWLAFHLARRGPKARPRVYFGTFSLEHQVWPGAQDRTVSAVYSDVLGTLSEAQATVAKYSEKHKALALTSRHGTFLIRKAVDETGAPFFLWKLLKTGNPKPYGFGYFYERIYEVLPGTGGQYMAPSCKSLLTEPPINHRELQIMKQARGYRR